MDRFLSKLDLRDIKIKPEGNQFLPHDDESQSDENHHEPISADQTDQVDEPSALNDEPEIEETIGVEPETSYEQPSTATLDPDIQEDDQREHADVGDDDAEILKVSAKSRPSAVAGAIAGVVRESGRAEVQAIGAGATNQAVKAVAIARDYLWESELDAICLPEFIDVIIDNEERTAIRLVVELR